MTQPIRITSQSSPAERQEVSRDEARDERVLSDAQAGDRQAQATLLRRLQDCIYRFCLSQLRSPEQAREATQETALRWLRQLPEFAGQSKLETWTLGIALNVCREMRRVRSHGQESALEMVEAKATEVVDELVEQEHRTQLTQLLGELSERQREAIVLRFFEQQSVEQTAQVMRCSPGTVKATVFQALRRLREGWMGEAAR